MWDVTNRSLGVKQQFLPHDSPDVRLCSFQSVSICYQDGRQSKCGGARRRHWRISCPPGPGAGRIEFPPVSIGCENYFSSWQDGSPGQKAGLEAFFDFVVAIGHTRLNQDNDTLKHLLKVDNDTKNILLRTDNAHPKASDLSQQSVWKHLILCRILGERWEGDLHDCVQQQEPDCQGGLHHSKVWDIVLWYRLCTVYGLQCTL